AVVVFLVLEVCVPRLPRPSRRLSSLLALSASAVVAVALLLGQVLTDGSVSSAPRGVPQHLPFSMGEFTAVAHGRTPLVDFVPQLPGVALYYADMPLRYVGPFLTAALCLPYIRSPSSLRLLLPATVAGLCVLNNTDFGAAAFVATGCCLAVAHGQVRRVGTAL